MPGTCTVCQHEDRDEVDRAWLSGTPLRDIADRTGLGKSALHRHRHRHVPERLAKARGAEEVAQADSLLKQLRELQARTLATLTKAEEADDLSVALRAIREARGNLELLAKLAGDLDESPRVELTLSPEWLEVRAVIVNALEPHPEARAAVAGALREVEHDGGG